jgi:hypothetical protein
MEHPRLWESQISSIITPITKLNCYLLLLLLFVCLIHDSDSQNAKMVKDKFPAYDLTQEAIDGFLKEVFGDVTFSAKVSLKSIIKYH